MPLFFNLPKQRYEFISLYDTAIDVEKSDIAKYKEDFNKKHLVFLEGQAPVVFVLRPLNYREKNCVLSALYDESIEKQEASLTGSIIAILAALESISDENVKWTKQEAELEQFPLELINELGIVIFNISNIFFHCGQSVEK